jgi:hypothetical protein
MRPSRCSRPLLIAALLGGAASAAPAQRAAAPQGAEFLLLPVGARATALGQAAAADGGTTEALFWNPAGLAALPRRELGVHHFSHLFSTGDALTLAVPSPALGSFALGAYVVDYGDFEITARDGGDPVGQATARNLALLASYATDLVGGLAAGLVYKLVQFRVDCTGDCTDVPTAIGTTHAVDVGVRYVATGRPLVIGLVVRHAGFKLQVRNQAQADPLPTRLAVGASYGLLRPSDGAEGFDVRVLADVQGALGQGSLAPVTLVGVETGVHEAVRLRGGYAFLDSEARGPSLGLGLRFGNVGVDLARVFFANDDLGEKEPIHFSLRALF